MRALSRRRPSLNCRFFITLTLEKNREVAKLFQLNGTPAFIIGNKIYPGAVSKNQLKEAIKIYRNR